MKRKNIKNTIKEHFFTNPSSKLRVREIERALNLPLPSVIKYCRELKQEGILTTLTTGKVVVYTASQSETYRLEKKLSNIKKLSNLIKYIKETLSNPPIFLFGSYSRGEDIENSDIDIFIETPSKKELKLKEFESVLGRKIQVFRADSIINLKNHHLANNIINGISLGSSLEVFK